METRRGITREVIVVGRLAFKLPSIRSWKCFLQGLVANIKEREHSQLKNKRLCPVLFYLPGGLLVVQRRVKVLTEKEAESFDLIGISAEARVWVEPKASSFGWLDGIVVAIDYGN